MIQVYDANHENFTNNGDAILTPISGTHKQVAGGNYELTLVHPIDLEGKWAHLVPDAIIKAPVPEETITTAFSGLDVDVYKTTEAAALRSGPSEPTTINYGSWSAGTVSTLLMQRMAGMRSSLMRWISASSGPPTWGMGSTSSSAQSTSERLEVTTLTM